MIAGDAIQNEPQAFQRCAALNMNRYDGATMSDDTISGLPKSRKEAFSTGSQFYFTGLPCKNSHISKRYNHGVCCECHKLQYSSWRESNRERVRAKELARYKKNAEKIRERKRAAQRVYRSKHPGRVKESFRAWAKNNREAIKVHQRRRKARLLAAPGSHNAADIRFLLESQRYKCANCKTSVRKIRHVDHIIPLARGGSDDWKNLQILCPRCNCSKKAKNPYDWAHENGRLL